MYYLLLDKWRKHRAVKESVAHSMAPQTEVSLLKFTRYVQTAKLKLDTAVLR